MTTPNGWGRTTLGELGRYLNGRGFKKDEWRPSGRPIIRIQNLTGSSEVFNYYPGEVEDRYVVRRGDLLVSWAATLGAYFWHGPEAVLNQHIFKVESNIDAKFHKYLLDHKLEELMRHTHGSGMVHITRGRFDSLPVDVPNFDEQRRIVDLLEDHLSRLDAADADLQAAHVKQDALWLSSLSAVRRNLMDSPTRTIGAIATTSLGKMLDAKKQTGTPTPYLRNINVRWGSFDLKDVQLTPLTEGDIARFDVHPGDVMVCEGGEPGRCAVWREPIGGVAFQKALHRIRVWSEDEVLPEFLCLMLTEAIRSGRSDGLFTGTTIKHLPQEKLRTIKLAVPTLTQQQIALARTAEVAAARVRLSMATDAAQKRSSALRKALLATAFAGRLSEST